MGTNTKHEFQSHTFASHGQQAATAIAAKQNQDLNASDTTAQQS
jgi:hypothetical protein